MKSYRALSIVAVALASSILVAPAGAALAPAPESPRFGQRLAQHVYDWYVPIEHNNNGSDPIARALKDRAAEFDPQLAQALKDDLAAQAKVSDDIVGIDFDPFLAAQDPSDSYATANA